MTRPVLMIGHFPPPVHGMAVAFDALADEFETVGPVVRIATSPHRLGSTPRYHLVRLRRVGAAIGALLAHRRRSRTVVFSADAGYGMVYLVALLLAARLLRYRCVVQHHSYAYLHRRSRLMAVVARVGGPCLHVCSCPEMGRVLRERYPRIRSVRTVSMAYALTTATPETPAAHRLSGTDPIVLGHFGNLTIEKGLAHAVSVLEHLLADGVACRLELAGPAVGDAERRLIADAARRHPDAFAHRGPVYGPDRDTFLAEVDVMLFPSRYAHESFGLVVWEGLLAGVPAIAYESGCLTQQRAGRGAVILTADESFVARAAQTVRGWMQDPGSYSVASDRARTDVARAIVTGKRAAVGLMTELTGV